MINNFQINLNRNKTIIYYVSDELSVKVDCRKPKNLARLVKQPPSPLLPNNKGSDFAANAYFEWNVIER